MGIGMFRRHREADYHGPLEEGLKEGEEKVKSVAMSPLHLGLADLKVYIGKCEDEAEIVTLMAAEGRRGGVSMLKARLAELREPEPEPEPTPAPVEEAPVEEEKVVLLDEE